MEIWEVFVIGAALSMDAFAASVSDGMAEPKMRAWKALLIAGTFALFQFAMPLLGYFCSSAFTVWVEKIAPWLSFLLLLLIGGKMIFDGAVDVHRRRKGEEILEKRALGVGKLLIQGVATSLDALAVGVTLLAADTMGGLPFHVVFCCLLIGGTTFLFSGAGVFLGKKVGDRFSVGAEIAGGIVLVAIGLKILLGAYFA